MTPKVAVKITFDRYFDKMVTSGGGGKTSLGAATRIRQEIRCLLYGGFLKRGPAFEFKCSVVGQVGVEYWVVVGPPKLCEINFAQL